MTENGDQAPPTFDFKCEIDGVLVARCHTQLNEGFVLVQTEVFGNRYDVKDIRQVVEEMTGAVAAMLVEAAEDEHNLWCSVFPYDDDQSSELPF